MVCSAVAGIWCCVLSSVLMVVGWGFKQQQGEVHGVLLRRQEDLATPLPSSLSTDTAMPSSSSFGSVLSNYWYVILVVVVLAVVGVVFLCAGFLRKKRRHERVQISRSPLHSLEEAGSGPEAALHGSTSPGIPTRVPGIPGNLSIGPSPIPSPQPSFSSSHKSMRSSGRNSTRRKRRNHSPGHTSSGSEDTIRPGQCYSMSSLASSASTIAPHNTKPHRTESFSSGRGSERDGMTQEHRLAPHQVKAMSIPDASPLHSAPSSLSIGSTHSRSSLSRRGATPTSGLIQVDVKVRVEQDTTAPSQIAAALAESARQLAQSAANFEEHQPLHLSRSSLSTRPPASGPSHHRKLFAYNSSSAVLQGHQHMPLPLVSLDRPKNIVNLDRSRPSTALTSHSLNSSTLTSHSLNRTAGAVGAPAGREWRRRNSSSSQASFKSDSVLPRLNQDLAHTSAHVAGPPFSHHLALQGSAHTSTHVADPPFSQHLPLQGSAHTSMHVADSIPPLFNHHLPLSQGSPAYSILPSHPITRPVRTDSTTFTTPTMVTTPTSADVENCRQPNTVLPQGRGENEAAQQQADPVDVPSSHSSSQPSLSHSGSALSLDPQLSSTASGYAATGSTSSLDTLSKPNPPTDLGNTPPLGVDPTSPADSASDKLQRNSNFSQQAITTPSGTPYRYPPRPPPMHPGAPPLGYPLPPLTAYPDMTTDILHQSANGGIAFHAPTHHTHSHHMVGVATPSDSITIDV